MAACLVSRTIACLACGDPLGTAIAILVCEWRVQRKGRLWPGVVLVVRENQDAGHLVGHCGERHDRLRIVGGTV